MNDIQCIIDILDERDNIRKHKQRQKRNNILIFASVLLMIIIITGIVAYMTIFNLEFSEAVYNTILVLTALDVPTEPVSSAQKVFIIIFVLISTIILLSVIVSSVDAIIDAYIND